MIPGVSDVPSRLTAPDVVRGVSRMFFRQNMMALAEMPLRNGRRADLVAIDAMGQITAVEIKVSLSDLRGDRKWPEYLDYCDRFFWALPTAFDPQVLDEPCFLPERTGVIIADRFDAAIIRDAPVVSLNSARRKVELLRFARRAAWRNMTVVDSGLQGPEPF